MAARKTTFYLSDELRSELKAVAAARGKTVTALLAEGAELVLARYRGKLDRQGLERRASEARAKFRRGLYTGPAVADSADTLVYAADAAPRGVDRGARPRRQVRRAG